MNEISRSRLSKVRRRTQDRHTHMQTDETERIDTATFAGGDKK